MQGLWKLWPATGTHGNVKRSSRCCFCLMARVETLGPSEHETNVYSQWKHPTRQIHFCIQPSRSLANLGSNCDAGLQRSFKPHLFYLFAFLSLLPFSDLFVSKSGLASPVFAPRQNPTGRFFLLQDPSPGTRNTWGAPLSWVIIVQHQPPWASQSKKEAKERCGCVPESRICPSLHRMWQDIHFNAAHIQILGKCIHKHAC